MNISIVEKSKNENNTLKKKIIVEREKTKEKQKNIKR